MRASKVLAILVSLWFAGGFEIPQDHYERSYPDAVIRALRTALKALNADLSDLNYEKKYAPTDFRLSVVDQTLDEPLSLLALAQQWIPALKSRSIDEPFQLSAALLEKPVSKSEGTVAGYQTSPLQALLVHLETVVKEFPMAFAELSPAEQSLLYDRLAYLFLRAEQTFQDKPAPADSDPVWKILERVHSEKMFSAVAVFLAGLEDFVAMADEAYNWEVLREASPVVVSPEIAEGEVIYAEDTEQGWVIIGGKGPNRYRCRCYLIVDPGGDDVYEQSAPPPYPRYSVIVDFAGDDRYSGSEVSVAGAYFGMSVIADLAGDDIYEGTRIAVGSAIMGAGILLDAAGDDHYKGDTFVMGAGGFGIGILKDLGGNDTYEGAFFAQGFASTAGVGILSDLAGNDVFVAGRKYLHQPLYADVYQSMAQGFSIGMRYLEKGGGIGILYDAEGNDTYSAEVYCQGAGYWYSLGMLIDESGHDSYHCHIYGQGAGIHLASGLLWDRGGNDGYYNQDGVGMGGGHDWAIGMLYDEAGNDYYAGAGITQGGGNANGVGILIDLKGNDVYGAAKDIVQGWGNPARNSGSFGILLDLGGKDRYSTQGKDDSLWVGPSWGVGYDLEAESKHEKE